MRKDKILLFIVVIYMGGEEFTNQIINLKVRISLS